MTAFVLLALAMVGVAANGTPAQTAVLCTFAGGASIVGFLAAFKGPRQTLVLNIIRGWLAFLYMCGYLYLLILRPDRGDWSQLMSGLGYVTWPVVWIYPPLFTYLNRESVSHLPTSFPLTAWATRRFKGRDAE